MGLEDFLKQPHKSSTEATPSIEIAAWEAAIYTLIGRFKAALSKYKQLTLHDWNVLREHRGVRYNANALTVEFGEPGEETVITLEPDAIKPATGVLGRASLNCGVRQVHLDCADDGKLWSYHWTIPHDEESGELTAQAIEDLVEELLKSSSSAS